MGLFDFLSKPSSLQWLSGLTNIATRLYGGFSLSNAMKFNASMSRLEGAHEVEKARYDAGIRRESMARGVGTAIAQAGASGFATGSPGTMLAVRDIIRSGELDVAMIRMAGDMGKWRGDETAKLLKKKGNLYKTAGLIGASKSLLDTTLKAKEYTNKTIKRTYYSKD